MRIHDAHRLLGPLPTGPGPATVDELLGDLDDLDIASAAVTPAWSLHGDPRDAVAYESKRPPEEWPSRLLRVPVVIPAPADTGWPASMDEVLGAPLVRACPHRHRFELLGESAMNWWRALEDRGTPLALDASECGLSDVHALATAVPGLRILLLAPGYRELRRLAELAERAPKIHFETGTIVGAGAIEWLARTIGAHRLVFGTGAPLWDDAGPRFQLEHLDLPAHDVELIAYGSWARMIGVAS